MDGPFVLEGGALVVSMSKCAEGGCIDLCLCRRGLSLHWLLHLLLPLLLPLQLLLHTDLGSIGIVMCLEIEVLTVVLLALVVALLLSCAADAGHDCGASLVGAAGVQAKHALWMVDPVRLEASELGELPIRQN